MDVSQAHAARLDAADELAEFRREFHFPTDARVYLCGHSLGLAPRSAARLVEEELSAWAQLGVEGHFARERPWLTYHERLAPALAKLAGAQPQEVVAMNSLTVNLHLMMISFYRPSATRYKIVIEGSAFPSDRYAIESQIRLHGRDPADALIVVGRDDASSTVDEDALCERLAREGASIATVMWPGVQYLTGQAFDLTKIAGAARAAGARVGFDLAHAIGNVPLDLHTSGADFAVWCGYKYLNGGPGALGGCFVHERHANDATLPRLAGWWGHDKASRFAMPSTFQPIAGAEGWQVSNPPIFSAAPLLASLELFERAGLARLRRKSLALTGYLADLLAARLKGAVTIITPLAAAAHGAQLSLRIDRSAAEARALHERLQREGVICDWREPDVIRVAPVPLYNHYSDVWNFVEVLAKALG